VRSKRLFRLIATPTPLAFAMLGFMVGLLWLSLSAQRSALPESPSAVTRSATGRVTLQEAIDGVRRFAGTPGLVLEGGLQTEDQGARGDGLYYLESVSPIRGEDFFKVDAATGEVVEATFRGRMAPAQDSAEVTAADAERRADRFARTHFWGFNQLQMVDRTSRTGEGGTIHSFKWSQIAAGSGAELPVSVSIAVSGRSGQVFWYLSQRDPLRIDATPTIDREQALATASAWLRSRDDRWDLDEPTSVRLQVLYDDDDRQQLVWSVTLRARQEGPRASVRLLVDAHDGQLIQTAS
jgi:hypothetical protein